jgi:hypothetical protein
MMTLDGLMWIIAGIQWAALLGMVICMAYLKRQYANIARAREAVERAIRELHRSR